MKKFLHELHKFAIILVILIMILILTVVFVYNTLRMISKWQNILKITYTYCIVVNWTGNEKMANK